MKCVLDVASIVSAVGIAAFSFVFTAGVSAAPFVFAGWVLCFSVRALYGTLSLSLSEDP
jgi:hypothetical protein